MSRTGKRKKIQTKKYLLGIIILLVVGIAVVVGLGIWKQRNLKKKTENAAYTQTEKKKTSGTRVILYFSIISFKVSFAAAIFAGVVGAVG